MLAATAREYSLGLATRNPEHFPLCSIVKHSCGT